MRRKEKGEEKGFREKEFLLLSPFSCFSLLI
jgi:hypothetical protein